MEKSDISQFIREKLSQIKNHQIELNQGCAACHVIFSMKQEITGSEQDAADMLSEILTEDQKLNQEFIETVEQIHMVERGFGGPFPKRDRESKDDYLDAYFKNVLDELNSDSKQYSKEAVLRKLLLSHIGLYIAQTLGVDYHAATEELYYILRKDDSKNEMISRTIQRILDKDNERII